jgi:hypothetical protein
MVKIRITEKVFEEAERAIEIDGLSQNEHDAATMCIKGFLTGTRVPTDAILVLLNFYRRIYDQNRYGV